MDNPTKFSFKYYARHVVSGVVEENGFNLDVGKESVFIEQNCTPSIMSNVEPVREELMINISNRLLQSNVAPFPFNLLLDGAFSSTSRSWIPVCRSSASSERMSGLARCCRRNILEQVPLAFAQRPHDILRRPVER